MKIPFAIIALVTAAVMLTSCKGGEASQTTGASNNGGAGNSAASKMPVQTTEPVICDQLYSYPEKNVELVIFCAGGTYLSFAQKDKENYYSWKRTEGIASGELDIPDGGFARVNADVTWLSGGFAGYMGNPQIDRVISLSPMSLAEAVEYAGIGEYDPEDRFCHSPMLCGDYLIIYSYPDHRVYRDGKLVGAYENIILAQGAMGLNDIDPEGMEIKDYASEFVYVICIGDKYYGYMTSMFENRYFTPLRDRNFNYMSSEFDIRDGETIRIRCEHSTVNGGKQGYVNAPIIRTIYDVEDNDYDSLTMRGMTPLSELSGELEDHPDDGAEAVFERNGKTWLIFRINGVYHVYADDYREVKNYGEYDSIAAVKKVVYGNNIPEVTGDIGEMYYVEPKPEDIVTDPETGIKYVKNQLLISAAPDAEKGRIQSMVKELGADIIGYIELTNDYQIEFDHDMSIKDFEEAADYFTSFQFVYNVTLNICTETSVE